MTAALLALVVVLAWPARPAPLPAVPPRPSAALPTREALSRAAADHPPSISEVAALFVPARPAAAPAAPAPALPPERVPWLHFVAFAVSARGETSYFFKNDQAGRVLMLVYRQPRNGWNLAVIQGDTYVLENGSHRYLVTAR